MAQVSLPPFLNSQQCMAAEQHFVSALMDVGVRLARLPTREIRNILFCSLSFSFFVSFLSFAPVVLFHRVLNYAYEPNCFQS
jgi:hypothetical protein